MSTKLDDNYVPRLQDRNSIKVVIDGTEMTIDKDSCNMSVVELFEGIVYDRQIERISRYLSAKYTDDFLTHEEAKHETLSKLNECKDFYMIHDIAKIIASEIVSSEEV